MASRELEKKEIRKEELENLLIAWSDGSMSGSEIHEWAELNYLPLSQVIGRDSAVHTAYAMGMILSQLDFLEPKAGSSKFAIEFLNTSIDDFGDRLRNFVDGCFGLIDEEEFNNAMERVRNLKMKDS